MKNQENINLNEKRQSPNTSTKVRLLLEQPDKMLNLLSWLL